MPKEEPASKEEIIEFCSNPQLINYVCLVMRPGLQSWAMELEYLRFKPDTPANEGFHMTFSKWPDDEPIPSLTMVIVSIDKSGQEFAESTLWKHGLKKSPPGMTAIMLGGPKGQEEFFLQGPNVFYLENHSKGAENVVYKNDPGKMALARDHEMAFCMKLMQDHQEWLKTPEGKRIADAYWAKHPSGYVR